MASIDTCYISSGCNRTPHCLDWGQNNLICYGSCRAVAIYRPEVELDFPYIYDYRTLFVSVTGSKIVLSWGQGRGWAVETDPPQF